ncbi:hypothetical protein BUALT_Bualt08G0044800 [Buddleja alternifolia]|uniref:Pectinesterase inhibitor domain-containing protein n=1 Tax=Buddleja alternifolia TaxID=168488 RepID=A0AAV6XEK9_9LAMI|nr:hypothetical protein BUALT_Bualt08G0044800 [Buddleja alternifolia]
MPMTCHLVLATLLLALFLCNSQADLIDDVCSKSTNPTLCKNTLRSDPRSRGADVRGLGIIIANKAVSVTIATQKIVESLPNGANKDACVFYCKDAFVYLNTCPDFLKLGQPNLIIALKTAVSRALNDLRTCDAKFGATEPGNLKASSKQAQDYANILSVIANSLPGRNVVGDTTGVSCSRRADGTRGVHWPGGIKRSVSRCDKLRKVFGTIGPRLVLLFSPAEDESLEPSSSRSREGREFGSGQDFSKPGGALTRDDSR